MKITDNTSIIPENLQRIHVYEIELDLEDSQEQYEGKTLILDFGGDDIMYFYDKREDEGFAESTKAKIDAYFETKEMLILEQVAQFKKAQEQIQKEHRILQQKAPIKEIHNDR